MEQERQVNEAKAPDGRMLAEQGNTDAKLVVPDAEQHDEEPEGNQEPERH